MPENIKVQPNYSTTDRDQLEEMGVSCTYIIGIKKAVKAPVNSLPFIIIQPANRAEVFCHGQLVARNVWTCWTNWLNFHTFHAHHFGNRFPTYREKAKALDKNARKQKERERERDLARICIQINWVTIRHIIVAISTCKQLFAAISKEFAVSLIVFASKSLFVRVPIRWKLTRNFSIVTWQNHFLIGLLLHKKPTTATSRKLLLSSENHSHGI